MTSFEEYTAGLVAGARETPGVEGLVLLGSASAAGAARRDTWSDHDFYAVLHPDDAVDLRASLRFLPFRDRIVSRAAEGPIGFSVVYDDGHLFEFAAGSLAELGEVAMDRHEVVAGDVSALVDGALERGARAPAESAADAAGLALVKAMVGYGRAVRGEVASGSAFVRGHAARLVAQAVRQRAGDDREPLDPLRRFDADAPEVAAELEAALQHPVPEAARALVALLRRRLEPGWQDFPTALADVVERRMQETDG